MDFTTEKKLRPLYEALDEGQNKIALQHCAKLLKKSPDWPLVKGLKALALVRSGKEEESLEICEQVKKTIPTDEATLQAVTMTLKELGKHSIIVELYENAANLQPKNEEFGNHWFMAMVRNNDFKGQQAAAVKLHRVFKQNKYLFWAIMSLALQGTELSYRLAERMMAKALEEKRLDAVEHMRLYLLILMNQKKNTEALALLTDNNSLAEKSLKDPEVRQIKSELLRETKRWDEVLVMSQEALAKENPDDWFHWLAYFEAMDALIESKPQVIQEAEALVRQSQDTVLKDKLLKRGPFLAELELDTRLFKLGKKDESVVLDHVVSYFNKFGSKNCAFEDIYSYVSFLKSDADKSKRFIEQLKQSLESAGDNQIKRVHKWVNIRKLERSLDLHTVSDVKVALKLVDELWKDYQEALPLGVGLEKTEMQYGDEFVILACHLLLDLYLEYHQPSYLIQAVALAETSLCKSIHNFQIKLILVRLYTMLGVYKRPFEIYKTMEIKQIQFDTMIHYFTERYSSLGCYDNLEDYLDEGLSIYKSNEVETPEMLVKAYQYGTFSKIQEFIEFRRRLDNSIQHSISQIELIHIDYLNASFQTKYAVQFFQDKDVSQLNATDDFIEARTDNRDFKVMINYNSDQKPTAEQAYKPAASVNKAWVQLMSSIYLILSIACETKPTGRNLEALVEGLIARSCQEGLTESEAWLAKYFTELAKAYVAVKQSKKPLDEFKSASDLLNQNIEKLTDFSEKNLGWNPFHQVSITLDAFNYGSILIEMMNRGLGLTSKDAKRKAAESTDPFLTGFVELQNNIKKSLQHIQSITKKSKDLFRNQLQKKLVKDMTDSDILLEYFKGSQQPLNNCTKDMIQSWNSSVTRLSDEIDRRIQKL